MDKGTARAINDLSNKVNTLVHKVDSYFSDRNEERKAETEELYGFTADLLEQICLNELGIESEVM